MLNLMMSALITLTAQAAPTDPLCYEVTPQRVDGLELVAVEELFLPQTLDDNDDVTIVVAGNLPNTCYKAAHTEATLDPRTQKITVAQYAEVKHCGECAQMLVPFWRTATVGVLPVGDFEVEAKGAPEATLTVHEGESSGPDGTKIANVTAVKVERDDASDTYLAVLTARFTDTCMRWEDVAVTVTEKTVEIVPSIELLPDNDGAACRPANLPTQWLAHLPAGLSEGRKLLHVKAAEGKSVVEIFTVTTE